MAREGAPALLAPSNRPNKATEDHRADFAAISVKTPVDEGIRAAFMQSKLRLAHTHPAYDIVARDAATKSIASRFGADAAGKLEQMGTATESDQPVPGGVGYGVFFSDAYKTAWGRGTAIAFDIVCPSPPGGNVDTFLYLTATNRSALGVEAFISYNGQDDTHFLVFDWARTDQWQTDIPLSQLADYLTTMAAHGSTYQTLPVWNATVLVSGTTWRNQVLLYNRVRGGWDLVYQFDYTATDAQQKTGWVGSWAPIVETFQLLYSGTSPMGALATQIASADNTGAWGNWTLLSAAESSLRVDNLGFQLVFLDPNYAFVVRS